MNRIAIAALLLTGLLFAPSSVVAQEDTSGHSAITPLERGGSFRRRHESFNQRVAEGNVDMVMIGDSITQGWGVAGAEVWAEYYNDRNAVNLGIGGDRTEHVLWRLDNGNIEGISPKLAVVMIGTNNSGANTSEEIAEGITAIVHKLRADLPETKILLLAIFSRGADDQDPKRQVNEGANEIIAELHDGEMVHYMNINDRFFNDNHSLRGAMRGDLLHLTTSGYRIWADAIEGKVVEFMGE